MTSVPMLKSLLGVLTVPFVLCKLSSEYVRCSRRPRRFEGGLDWDCIKSSHVTTVYGSKRSHPHLPHPKPSPVQSTVTLYCQQQVCKIWPSTFPNPCLRGISHHYNLIHQRKNSQIQDNEDFSVRDSHQKCWKQGSGVRHLRVRQPSQKCWNYTNAMQLTARVARSLSEMSGSMRRFSSSWKFMWGVPALPDPRGWLDTPERNREFSDSSDDMPDRFLVTESYKRWISFVVHCHVICCLCFSLTNVSARYFRLYGNSWDWALLFHTGSSSFSFVCLLLYLLWFCGVEVGSEGWGIGWGGGGGGERRRGILFKAWALDKCCESQERQGQSWMAQRVNDTTTHLLDDRGLLLLLLMGEESRCFFTAYVLRSWLDSLRLGNVSSGKKTTPQPSLCCI